MKDIMLCMTVVTTLILLLERRLDMVIISDGWLRVKEESWVIYHGVESIVLLCVYVRLSSHH